jgi:hypothetical protein
MIQTTNYMVTMTPMLPVRKGPTERSPFSAESSTPQYYVPSSDSCSEFDLLGEDGDGAEMMLSALPSGRKTRQRKRRQGHGMMTMGFFRKKVMSENVLMFISLGEMCKLCILHSLETSTITHTCRVLRKGDTRLSILHGWFTYQAWKIFCPRKMNLAHIFATSSEACKVSGKWVAKVCEKSMRMDSRHV